MVTRTATRARPGPTPLAGVCGSRTGRRYPRDSRPWPRDSALVLSPPTLVAMTLTALALLRTVQGENCSIFAHSNYLVSQLGQYIQKSMQYLRIFFLKVLICLVFCVNAMCKRYFNKTIVSQT